MSSFTIYFKIKLNIKPAGDYLTTPTFPQEKGRKRNMQTIQENPSEITLYISLIIMIKILIILMIKALPSSVQ